MVGAGPHGIVGCERKDPWRPGLVVLALLRVRRDAGWLTQIVLGL